MSLRPNTRLGPNEILATFGADETAVLMDLPGMQ